MGAHIGRITSPLTGNEEAISEVGYHFPHTPENMNRWRAWFRGAALGHFFSFFLTCIVCLPLPPLIGYIVFFDSAGQRIPGSWQAKDMAFVWDESVRLAELIGPVARWFFLAMGVAILF